MKLSFKILLCVCHVFFASLGAMKIEVAAKRDSVSSVSGLSIPSENPVTLSPFQQALQNSDTTALKAALSNVLNSEEPHIEIRHAFDRSDLKEIIEVLLEDKNAAQHITKHHITAKITTSLNNNDAILFKYLLTKIDTDELNTLLKQLQGAGQWCALVNQEIAHRSCCVIL